MSDGPAPSGEAPPPALVVHLVHGTWAHGRTLFGRAKAKQPGDPVRWFEDEAPFRQALLARPGRPLSFRPFSWSGENSFTARRDAAEALARTLAEAMDRDPGAAHAVVAHSHGGTVAFDALQRLPDAAERQVVGLLTLGTPFVSLQTVALGTWEFGFRAFSWRIGFAILTLWAGWLLSLPFGLVGWLIGLLLVPALGHALFGRDFWSALRPTTRGLYALLPSKRAWRGCPLIALRAPGDEAALAISLAQFADDIVLGASLKGVAKGNTRLETAGRRSRLALPGLVIAFWAAITMVMMGLNVLGARGGPDLWLLAAAGWINILAMLIGIALTLLMLGFVAAFATARAVGPEAARYAGWAVLDADVLPPGVPATVWSAPLSSEDRRDLDMRHALYALPHVQQTVADFLGGLKPRAESDPTP